MEFLQTLYKGTQSRFEKIDDSRIRRSERVQCERLVKRSQLFESRRPGLEVITCEETEKQLPAEIQKIKAKKGSRAEQLKVWKEEKQKKLNMLKAQKKPIFKVSVVRYKPSGSPALSNITNHNTLKQQKKNTTASYFPENKEFIFKAPKLISYSNKVTVPLSPKRTRSFTKKSVRDDSKTKKSKLGKERNDFCIMNLNLSIRNDKMYNFGKTTDMIHNDPQTKINHKELEDKKIQNTVNLVSNSKGKVNDNHLQRKASKNQELFVKNDDTIVLNKSESTNIPPKNENHLSVECLITPVSPDVGKELNIIAYSPFVTKTRGNARSSSLKKLKKRLTEEQKFALEVGEEEETFRSRIQVFKLDLKRETNKLLEECKKWTNILNTNKVPAEAQGEIHVAIGKTQLLTSDKFKQFEKLIQQCEEGDPKIKLDDLQGFWDWVLLEVDKSNESFYKLELLKSINWTEKEKAIKNPRVKAKMVLKTKEIVPKPVTGISNIRQHILAARKKQMGNSSEMMKSELLNSSTTKVFDGNFFKIESPVKSPSTIIEQKCITPKKFVLRAAVLNAEACRHSGLAVVAATNEAKTLTPNKGSPKLMVTPISYENVGVSPSKGILKTNTSGSNSINNSRKKSVVFNISDNKIADCLSCGVDEIYTIPTTTFDTSCDTSVDQSLKIDTPSKTPKLRKSQLSVGTPVRRSTRLANRMDQKEEPSQPRGGLFANISKNKSNVINTSNTVSKNLKCAGNEGLEGKYSIPKNPYNSTFSDVDISPECAMDTFPEIYIGISPAKKSRFNNKIMLNPFIRSPRLLRK